VNLGGRFIAWKPEGEEKERQERKKGGRDGGKKRREENKGDGREGDLTRCLEGAH